VSLLNQALASPAAYLFAAEKRRFTRSLLLIAVVALVSAAW